MRYALVNLLTNLGQGGHFVWPVVKSYIEGHRADFLFLLLYICIFLVVWNVMALIFRAMSGKKLGVRKGSPFDLGKLFRQYYSEITGALIGFAVLFNGNIPFSVAGIFCGAAIGHTVKVFYGWFTEKLHEEKRLGEIITAYNILSTYAASGYSLYDGLNATAYLGNITAAAFRECVAEWGQGPARALDKLGKGLIRPEGVGLARILQRAYAVGPGKMAAFLEYESTALEEITIQNIQQGFSARALVQTLYLALPGLALVGVTMLPAGYHLTRAIMGVTTNF